MLAPRARSAYMMYVSYVYMHKMLRVMTCTLWCYVCVYVYAARDDDAVRNVYSYMCAQYVARDDTMLLCMLNIRKYVARDDDDVRNMYNYIYAQYVARVDTMLLCMLICICCA